MQEHTDTAYTIKVPVGWQKTVSLLDGLTPQGELATGKETVFTPPDSEDVVISILALKSASSGWKHDANTYADLVLDEIEADAIDGTMNIPLRKSSEEETVIAVHFQLPGVCRSTKLMSVIVLPTWFLTLELTVCSHQYETYELLLLESFNSFAPTAAGLR